MRKAIVSELAAEASGLRLMEIRCRVEAQLGEALAPARFRDYVNYHSKGTNGFLERLAYGTYRLRSTDDRRSSGLSALESSSVCFDRAVSGTVAPTHRSRDRNRLNECRASCEL
jgi:hypothetical protein